MPNHTVSGNVDTMMRAADNAAIRSAIGVGQTDVPALGGLVIPNGGFIRTNGANLNNGIRLGGGAFDEPALAVSWVNSPAISLSTGRYSSGSSWLAINSTSVFGWGASSDLGTATPSMELILAKDAAGILAQRNGTTAQAFRVYSSYTDTANYRRLALTSSGGEMRVLAQGEGTGAGASLNFGSGTSPNWQITTAGNLVAYGDNTYDIGASGANRPKNIYAATSFLLPFNGSFLIESRLNLSCPTNGRLLLANSTANDFDRLQLGGATDVFPAIARDGAGIKFTGAAAGLTSWVKVPAVAVSALPAAATAGVGARSFVNNALNPIFGNAVVGSGLSTVPVYSDGTNWNVG